VEDTGPAGRRTGKATSAARGNDPPASPYYTGARLSRAGQIALAAERGEIAPVPIGLINGNTHRQGTRPPFRPAAVIDAIRQVLAQPRLPAQQITALMGPPDFITGCVVTGSLAQRRLVLYLSDAPRSTARSCTRTADLHGCRLESDQDDSPHRCAYCALSGRVRGAAQCGAIAASRPGPWARPACCRTRQSWRAFLCFFGYLTTFWRARYVGAVERRVEVLMRADDDADFVVFVAASSRRLLRTAFLITGDVDRAEDLLQTALERSYLRWGRIRRSELPEAYVRRVIVNAAVDTWRASRRLRTVQLDESQLPAMPDAALERVPGRDALLACVRELPARQRAVLVLRYFDDLTEAETARVMGCSVGTVKSQHARAMARLRQLLPDGRTT
jgi:RNA polymerase sigma-70 factor (sigma-E family)